MALTDFTSYDDVRAAIGVSDEEISDETLGLPVYEQALLVEFDDIDLNLRSTFQVTVSKDTPTEAEKRFIRACKLFSTYAVAQQLAASLPMFAPKSLGDGKASMSRFADSPYRDTVRKICTLFDKYKVHLSDALLKLNSGSFVATPRNLVAISGLDTDPVTNEAPV